MFDLNTASVGELTKKFPELGKLRAEDIVAWRDENGALVDGKILTAELGFPSSLAKQLAAYIHAPVRAEQPPASESTSVAEALPALETNSEPTPAVPADDVLTAEGSDLDVARAPEAESEAELVTEPEAELVTESEAELVAEPEAAVAAEPEAALAAEPEAAVAAEPGAAEPEAESASERAPDVFSESFEDPGPPVFTTDEPTPFPESRSTEPTPVFEESADAALTTSSAMVAAEPHPAPVPAVSQVSALPTPSASASAATAAPAGSEAQAASTPSPRPRTPRWLIGAIIISNAALAGGLFGLRREERQARAPVAAMSVEVKSLQSQQVDLQAQLEDTRHRLDQQASTLAKTVKAVESVEERQQRDERAVAEVAARQAKDSATLTARVNRLERTVDDELYTVEEAIKIIQSVRPAPPRPATSGHRDEPKATGETKPAAH